MSSNQMPLIKDPFDRIEAVMGSKPADQPTAPQALTFFESIALPLVKRVGKVIPLYPKTKQPHARLVPKPLDDMSDDLGQIHAWGLAEPNANVGVYARQVLGGLLFLDKDGALSLRQKYETETGKTFPKTLLVRSSVIQKDGKNVSKGHWYFYQTPKTIALPGNIPEDKTRGLFSLRVNNEQVCSIGSIHPVTTTPYEVAEEHPIAHMPDELLEWLLTQVVDKAAVNATKPSEALIPRGAIHGWMLKKAGELRDKGLNADEIEPVLLRLVHENCQGPIDDSKVIAMSSSICKYEPGKDRTILVGGHVAGSSATSELSYEVMDKMLSEREASDAEEKTERQEAIDRVRKDLESHVGPHPKFPLWCLEGTSIYRGLVEPYCSRNSRYEEFLWMPAATMLLNYLGGKVRLEYTDVVPSIYLIMIGKKGRMIKSASIESAMRYFQFAGILDQASTMTRNAEGRSLIWTIGSTEGVGLEAQRVSCKNIILYWDELSTLVKKASIEGSSMKEHLLTMYGAGKFSNAIKARRETFDFAPGSYCTSLIAACTDKTFKALWAKLGDGDTGFDDRFVFCYQPETFKKLLPYTAVNTQEGAKETRKLIDRAVQKGVYSIDDRKPFSDVMNEGWENRQEGRAEKWSLYFAVDLGRDSVDEDCAERGIEITRYERAVKKRFRTYQAENKFAALQLKIKDLLMDNQGVLGLTELTHLAHAERHGTLDWGNAVTGLIRSHEIDITGSGKRNDPKIVTLLKITAPDDEE